MQTYPLKEIFNIYGGNSGLIEKVIYVSQSKREKNNIPVFSSATEEAFLLPKVDKNLEIKDKKIKSFSTDKSYIIVTRNGKAGLMKVLHNIEFTINDHAYILETKKSFKDKVNLDYFVKRYQSDFLNLVTSKDSNGTFSKELAEHYEIELPDIDKQLEVVEADKKLKEMKTSLNELISRINKRGECIVKSGKPYLVRELFHHFQGHQLTDKYIYDNSGNFPVYSGSNNEPKGFINEPLFEDELKLPCLIYQTKGNNEFKSRVVRELFNANNTAVLRLKDSKRHLVNMDYIQLIISYNLKLSISSQEGVSYIDTKILNTEISLPDIEEQNEIVDQTRKIKILKNEINDMIEKIGARLNTPITIV